MSADLENFRAWYVDILQSLYPNRKAGFAIVLICFPLLDRYLSNKVGLEPSALLSCHPKFAEAFGNVFDELNTPDVAKSVWAVYRNGLLHKVTFFSETRRGKPLPLGGLTHDRCRISVRPDGSLLLNPVDFADRVIETILGDFPTYQGTCATAELPCEFRVNDQMTGTWAATDIPRTFTWVP